MGRGGDTTGGKLTANQEKFTQELIKGKSQREAYKIAYPNSQKWKETSIDISASKLFANPKVKQRYQQLIGKHQEKSLRTLSQLLDKLYKALDMALGIEATPNIVREITEEGIEVVKQNYRINGVDLKAVATLSQQISKLEGWQTEKIEHSGIIPVQIIDDI